MPSGVYPRTAKHRAINSAAHRVPKSSKWLAARKNTFKEHPNAMLKARNTIEVYELIQNYGMPLINRLRSKYWDLNGRCNNLHWLNYKNYGGRGIQNSFPSVNIFISYVINELHITALSQIENLQIDRIDNDGNYEPGNIRFVTHRVNQQNKRR